jgi:hypothetical protein
VFVGGVCRRQDSGHVAICLSSFRPFSRFISLSSTLLLLQGPAARRWLGSIDCCFKRDAEGHVTMMAKTKTNFIKGPENLCGEICISNLFCDNRGVLGNGNRGRLAGL